MQWFAPAVDWLEHIGRVLGLKYLEIIALKLRLPFLIFPKLALDLQKKRLQREVDFFRLQNLTFEFHDRSINVAFARRLATIKHGLNARYDPFENSVLLSNRGLPARGSWQGARRGINAPG
ncbi:MAG: hypothetical protein AAGA94_16950 [Pseudomonadota bacterium]